MKKNRTSFRGPVISLAVLALLVAGSSLVPVLRLWGVNHPAYFSLPLRWAAMALVIVSFLPAVGRVVHATLISATGFAADRRRSRVIIIAGSLLAVGIFFWLQSSSLLLGDGHVIGTTYDKVLAGDMSMNTSSVGTILQKKHIEPGAAILYLVGAKGLSALTGASGTASIRLFNCLLGGLFVWTLLTVVLRSDLRTELKLWLMILVLTSGAMELFFGYVEYYTPLILCGTFYVITSLRAAHRRGPLWLPVVLALACSFIHIQGSLLLPSLLVLLVGRFGNVDSLLKRSSMTLGVFTVAAFVVAYLVPKAAAYLLPLVGSAEAGGVLGIGHGLDILNELLLLFPLTFLVVIMGLQVGRNSGAVEPAGKQSAWFTLPLEWHYTGMLLLPAVMFLVFFKPAIGMARDWDLFSILVLGLVPAAMLILNRFLTAAPEMSPRLTAPALALALVLAVGWVGINASPVRSADRFGDVLEFDSSRSDYAYETLARHYQDLGLHTEAVAAQKKAVAVSGNPRQVVNLSVMYRDAGMIAESKQLLRELLVVNPTYWDARRILILQLMKDEQFAESAAVSREGIKTDPKLGGYHFLLGKNLMILGRFDEAEPVLLKARSLGVPASMGTEIDRMLEALPALRR